MIPPAQIYSMTKTICDQMCGIPSQCFKAEYINNMPAGYFDTFLLKVNGKLAGRNSILDPRQFSSMPFNMARTMFVGIDVNHPAETERVASSVCAAVGSLVSFEVLKASFNEAKLTLLSI